MCPRVRTRAIRFANAHGALHANNRVCTFARRFAHVQSRLHACNRILSLARFKAKEDGRQRLISIPSLYPTLGSLLKGGRISNPTAQAHALREGQALLCNLLMVVF